MLAFLGRVLNLRRDEWRGFIIFGLMLFLFFLGKTWAQVVIPAAFVEQVGVELLPYLFIGDAIAVILATMVYSVFADRYTHHYIMMVMIVLSVISIALGRVMLAFDLITIGYIYLYLVFRIISDALVLHLGTYIFSHYDAQQAKRTYPLLFSVLWIGIIISGFTVPLLNSLFAPENIIVMWGITVVILGVLVFFTPRLLGLSTAKTAKTDNASRVSVIENLKEGLIFLGQSRYLQAMAGASLLAMVILAILNFEAFHIFEVNLRTAAEISNFTGTLTGLGGLVALPIQLFLYSRIVARIGIGNTNLIYPFATAALTIAMILFPSPLWVGGLAYLNITAINITFRNITDDLLYNAVPTKVRGRARAFIGGVIVHFGTLIAGIVTILPITTQSWFIPVVLGGLTVAYLVGAFVVRRMYGQALIQMLQSENALLLNAASFNIQDAATQNFLKNKLKESTDADVIVVTARLLAEGLGKDVVPILEPYARTGEPEIRVAILETLASADIRGDAMRRLYMDALKDADPRLRRIAINGMERSGMTRDPEYLELVTGLMKENPQDSEENVNLQAHIIASLLRSNDAKYKPVAEWALHDFLESQRADVRAAGIGALVGADSIEYLPLMIKALSDSSDTVRIAAATAVEGLIATPQGKAAAPSHMAALRKMLEDPVERVRLAGVRVLAAIDASEHLPTLVRSLNDSSRAVRNATVDIITGMGKPAVPVLKPHLEGKDEQLRKMSAFALSRINRDDYASVIHSQIRQDTQEIYQNYARLASLESQANYIGVEILRNAIEDRNHVLKAEIFYMITAIYPGEAVNVVRNSLGSEVAGTRASAVEALETMIPVSYVAPIAALFDPSHPDLQQIGRSEFDIQPIAGDAIIRHMLNHEQPLFRAITAFALGDLALAAKKATATENGSGAKPGRRRGGMDLLGALTGADPTVPAKKNNLLTFEQIQEMLESKAQDPVEDVRIAVGAARRVIEGKSIIEAARKEGSVLSAIEKVIFLKGIPFFQGMTVDQLKVLANVCEEQLFTDNTVIFDEGDPGGTLYVIVSGKVAIERHNKIARTSARLSTLETRSYFGEATLFDNSPCTTTSLALEDTLTLRLRYEHLVALMQEYPELSLHLIKILSKRLQETSDQVASLTRSMSRSMHQVYDRLD